ncbi:hypothetical protein [Pseudonocardia sp.]|uniref:hypothetical protein n=1 Tax=Pseudonocardia sp. TaxID=60912 RepID=UPI003D145A90
MTGPSESADLAPAEVGQDLLLAATRRGTVELAGVGPHRSGTDGFLLRMPGIRDLPRTMRYADLPAAVPRSTAPTAPPSRTT